MSGYQEEGQCSKIKNISQQETQDVVLPSNKNPSQYSLEYKQFFLGGACLDLKFDGKRLESEGIFYNEKCFQRELKFAISYQSDCMQVLKILISFSYFTIEITALNVYDNSRTKENLEFIAQGSFGKIFKNTLKQQNVFAIKSIPYFWYREIQEVFGKTLKIAIFQYCLCKLFSALEVGPSVITNSGFDLIIFNDSVQFCMELCQLAKPKTSMKEMKQSLNLMHSLNIIHGDIKLENIMWSSTFQKNVFIDFGLSRILKQCIGELTYTSFFGTYHYSCKEMKKLFCAEQFEFVDLYYNDVYALKKVFEVSSDKSFERNNQNSSQVPQEYQNLLTNFELISLIHLRNVDKIKRFLLKNTQLRLCDQIIEYLKNLQWSKETYQIYCLIEQNVFLTAQQSKDLLKVLRFQSLQINTNKERIKLLSQRTEDILNQFQGTLTNIMLFFQIYYCEDVTPNAANLKTRLKATINKTSPLELHFWQSLVIYTKNPYVSRDETADLFDHVMRKIGIQKWEISNIPQLSLYVKARQIAQIARINYNFNLYQMGGSDDIEEARRTFESFPVARQVSMKILEWRSIARKNEMILDKYKLMEEIRQKFHLEGEAEENYPLYVRLIIKGIDIEFSNTNIINFNQLSSYVDNFIHFKPALKTTIMTFYQQLQIERNITRLTVQKYNNILLKFFYNSNQSVFNFKINVDTLLLNFFASIKLFQSEYSWGINEKIGKMTEFIKIYGGDRSILNLTSIFSKIYELINSFSIEIQKPILCFCQNKLIQTIQEKQFEIQRQAILPLINIFEKVIATFIPTTKSFLLRAFAEIEKRFLQKSTVAFLYHIKKIDVIQKHKLMDESDILKEVKNFMDMERENVKLFSQAGLSAPLYIDYVLLAGKFQIDITKQIAILTEMMLSARCTDPMISYCIANFYSDKQQTCFDEYFDIIVKKVRTLNNKNWYQVYPNVEFYYSSKILVETYIYHSLDKIRTLKLFIQRIRKRIRDQKLQFNSCCNLIIVIEILLRYYFKEGSQNCKHFVQKCFMLANLMYHYCEPIFVRYYKKISTYIKYFMSTNRSQQFLFGNRKKRKTLIELVRCHNYSFTPNGYFEMISNGKQALNLNHRQIKIMKMIRGKLNLLVKNRKEQVKEKKFQNLAFYLCPYYHRQLNMQDPFQDDFEYQSVQKDKM